MKNACNLHPWDNSAERCDCAFYRYESKEIKSKIRLDSNACIFTAEAVAILEALQYELMINYKHVVIMSVLKA